MISFWQALEKKMAKPNHFCWADIWKFWNLMSQCGQMRKKWAFPGCAKIVLQADPYCKDWEARYPPNTSVSKKSNVFCMPASLTNWEMIKGRGWISFYRMPHKVIRPFKRETLNNLKNYEVIHSPALTRGVKIWWNALLWKIVFLLSV